MFSQVGTSSDEHEIAGIDRGRAHQGDGLADEPVRRGDQPVGRGLLHEGGAGRQGAIAGEVQKVASGSAVAIELVDAVALSLAGLEDEGVVAAEARECRR